MSVLNLFPPARRDTFLSRVRLPHLLTMWMWRGLNKHLRCRCAPGRPAGVRRRQGLCAVPKEVSSAAPVAPTKARSLQWARLRAASRRLTQLLPRLPVLLRCARTPQSPQPLQRCRSRQRPRRQPRAAPGSAPGFPALVRVPKTRRATRRATRRGAHPLPHLAQSLAIRSGRGGRQRPDLPNPPRKQRPRGAKLQRRAQK